MQREADHAVALDRDRAIVTGRVRVEDREQDRLRQQPAERDPAGHVAIERFAAGNHDQRTDALRRQPPHRAHHHVDRVERRRRRLAPQPPHRDLLEEPAQVLLEHHREHDHQHGEEALEDPDRHLELELARHQECRRRDRDAAEREARPRTAQPRERRPQHQRDERDVDEVGEANAVCNLILEHGASGRDVERVNSDLAPCWRRDNGGTRSAAGRGARSRRRCGLRRPERGPGGRSTRCGRRSRARRVRKRIDELPEIDRTVLLLRDIEGLENEEVAGLFGRRHRHREDPSAPRSIAVALDPQLREMQS